MSNEIIGLIGIVVLLILICSRVWIGAALAIVGFFGLLIMSGSSQAFSTLGTAPYMNIDNYTITAIPMFTLMGMVIAETSIGKGLYEAAYRFLGRKNGGVASATVVASGLMGAITGSDNVSCVIMSKLALPELKRFKYNDGLATASVAAGAPLAIIIPPSMAFIMYGMLTEQSVGKLFMAGLIPGAILVSVFVLAISISCNRNKTLGPKGDKFTLKEKMNALVGVLPTIILFLLVLGGIYFGICTTTEAGAIGALGAIIIAGVTKQLSAKKMYTILRATVVAVGFVIFMIAGTFIFIKFITLSHVPLALTELIIGMEVNRFIVLLAVAIMYLVLGMIMPHIPMMILTVPLLFPAMTALGFDPIWFGCFVVMMMALGAISPPIGMDVFIVAGISKVPVLEIYKGMIPFLIADVAVIILICVFPQIVTFLPSLM
ncbi:TRAP transporter large permease [Alkalibaculum sporogenes]|uniref:TRAP transporter large permease n=1 Tax=Alkalibaculum sporogenes TaxID=2655001 RepID=UPI00187B2C78|nr:TRAP transporter large permease [Alkalibaculum sporogenes]